MSNTGAKPHVDRCLNCGDIGACPVCDGWGYGYPPESADCAACQATGMCAACHDLTALTPAGEAPSEGGST